MPANCKQGRRQGIAYGASPETLGALGLLGRMYPHRKGSLAAAHPEHLFRDKLPASEQELELKLERLAGSETTSHPHNYIARSEHQRLLEARLATQAAEAEADLRKHINLVQRDVRAKVLLLIDSDTTYMHLNVEKNLCILC